MKSFYLQKEIKQKIINSQLSYEFIIKIGLLVWLCKCVYNSLLLDFNFKVFNFKVSEKFAHMIYVWIKEKLNHFYFTLY